MKLTIKQQRDSHVWAWFVMDVGAIVGGGYGRTEADARNDAESFKAEKEYT